MWPLLLCSVISLALTLERWKYFHKEDSGRVFPQQFCALLRESRWQEAWQLTENTPGEMAALGRKLLSAPPQVRTKESYIVGESRQLLQHFEKGLTYLQVIVTLAPILGLLGTITGMMASFDALGTRWENPLAVTAGWGKPDYHHLWPADCHCDHLLSYVFCPAGKTWQGSWNRWIIPLWKMRTACRSKGAGTNDPFRFFFLGKGIQYPDFPYD